MVIIYLVIQLFPGEPDLFRIDHHDEIACIHIGSKDRLVFPAKIGRNSCGELAEDLVLSVYKIPLRSTSFFFANWVLMNTPSL